MLDRSGTRPFVWNIFCSLRETIKICRTQNEKINQKCIWFQHHHGASAHLNDAGGYAEAIHKVLVYNWWNSHLLHEETINSQIQRGQALLPQRESVLERRNHRGEQGVQWGHRNVYQVDRRKKIVRWVLSPQGLKKGTLQGIQWTQGKKTQCL